MKLDIKSLPDVCQNYCDNSNGSKVFDFISI